MPFEAALVGLLSDIPAWLATIIIGGLPVAELRGAIPIAIGVYGMDAPAAFILSVIGNTIPVIPLLLFLDPVSSYLRRYSIFDRFFDWLFTRTHRKHSENFEKYGTLALTLFVAMPLPVTGAWTGCAAAFVFGIRFKHALIAIISGIIIAGIIVTTITTAGISLLDVIF